MKAKTKFIVSFLVLCFVLVGFYFFSQQLSLITGYSIGGGDLSDFTECLNKNSVEFYTGQECPGCEMQSKVFGNSFKNINKYNCGVDMENCPNLRGIPAWFIQGEIHYGFKNLSELEELSGCKI